MSSEGRQGKMNYSDMYQRVRHKRCGLGELVVEGRERTREAVVQRELEGLKGAKSLEEMKDVLLTATQRLKELDIFDEVAMTMDAGEMGDDKAKTDTSDVYVKLRESSMFKFHAGTYVNQNSEGSLEASMTVKNALGWAERAEASYEYGSENSNEYCLSYLQPRLFGSMTQIQSRLFHTRQNNQRHCSFTEDMNGASVTMTSESGTHEVTIDGGWQEISDRSRMASHAILQQKGHRVRATAAYTWRQQWQIEPEVEGLPQIVSGVKSTTEIGAVSPMGGAVGFAKQVLSGAVILPLSESTDLTFTAKVGALLPLGDRMGATSSCITDRFFLGGVSTLRGFRTRGIGPTDARRPDKALGAQPEAVPEGAIPDGPPIRRDALGGDLMCSLLAEYNFPLPHPILQAFDVKGHVFVNGGNVMLLDGGGPLKTKLEEFAKTFRFTTGAGIYVSTAMGRFEVNYCRVLTSQLHDRPKHGVQFGFMAGVH